MANYNVCRCDQMPGLHNPSSGNCDAEKIVKFTKKDLKDQSKCKHDESMFDGVCAMCGHVDEKAYLNAIPVT